MKLAVPLTRSEAITLAALLGAAVDKGGLRFLIAAADGFNDAREPSTKPIRSMTTFQADHLIKRLKKLA